MVAFLELFSPIEARILEYDSYATWVVLAEFGEVVHLAIDGHPAVLVGPVLL